MARILAIDYGGKRCGIAVTDESKIIASGLTTVDTKDLLSWLQEYVSQEEVELFVVASNQAAARAADPGTVSATMISPTP